MKLFQINAGLSSSRQVVPTATDAGSAVPPDICKDVREPFQVRGGRCQYLVAAFDAACAERKALRHFPGILYALEVFPLSDRAFHPARWQEDGNGGRFVRPHPKYCDAITHPSRIQQLRMRSVDRRLNPPATAASRVRDLSNGWKAAAAAFSPRKKPDNALKAALRSDKPADPDTYASAFRRLWTLRSSKATAKPSKPARPRKPAPPKTPDLFGQPAKPARKARKKAAAA